MEQDTVELQKDSLKKILRMHVEATDLLEEIPVRQDEGRLSEISQHIGAELEARITEMNKAEKQDYIIKQVLEEIHNEQTSDKSLEQLENEVLNQ